MYQTWSSLGANIQTGECSLGQPAHLGVNSANIFFQQLAQPNRISTGMSHKISSHQFTKYHNIKTPPFKVRLSDFWCVNILINTSIPNPNINTECMYKEYVYRNVDSCLKKYKVAWILNPKYSANIYHSPLYKM